MNEYGGMFVQFDMNKGPVMTASGRPAGTGGFDQITSEEAGLKYSKQTSLMLRVVFDHSNPFCDYQVLTRSQHLPFQVRQLMVGCLFLARRSRFDRQCYFGPWRV